MLDFHPAMEPPEANRPHIALTPIPSADLDGILRAVLGAVDYGVMVTDLEHRTLLCNARFGEIFGVSIEQVVRNDVESVREMVRGRIVDTDRWEANLAEIYRDPNETQADELRLRNPEAVLHRYSGPIWNEAGTLIGRIWTFLDITNRSRRQSLERLTSEIVTFFHRDPRVVAQVLLDRLAAHYGSIALLSLLEDDFLRFFAAAGVPEHLQGIPGNLLRESYCQFCLARREAMVIQNAASSPETASMLPAQLGLSRYAGVPLFTPDGRVIGTLCVLDDRSETLHSDDDLRFLAIVASRISSELDRYATIQGLESGLETANKELQAAQNALIESEKLAVAGALSASIAHDIRNILASVSVQLSMFDEDPEAAVAFIKGSLGRFDVLAHRLLSYARPSGAIYQHVDLEEVVAHVVTLLDAQFKIAKVDLIVESSGQEFYIRGDEGRIEHLIVNLAINALQAQRPGGWVKVVLEQSSGWVTMEVSDNGPGIADAVRTRLFEPFSTTKINGFGLGLYSCLQIMEGHGGKLICESDPKSGTRMRAFFPVAS